MLLWQRNSYGDSRSCTLLGSWRFLCFMQDRSVPSSDIIANLETHSPNPTISGEGMATASIGASASPVNNSSAVASDGGEMSTGLEGGSAVQEVSNSDHGMNLQVVRCSQCESVIEDVGAMPGEGGRLCSSCVQGCVDQKVAPQDRDRADNDHADASTTEEAVVAASYNSVIGTIGTGVGGVQGVVGVPVGPPISGGVGVGDPADKNPSDSSKRRRTWTDDEKHLHKSACKGKGKLTLGQKIEIVRRHETSDPEDHKTQAQLATMFGKSRSAISKILRPGNIAKLKHTYQAGVNPAVKRFFAAEHPELDKKIHRFIDNARRNCEVQNKRGYPGMGAVCRSAESFAREMGILDFRASNGWYSRFIKRYGLSTRAPGGAPAESGNDSDVGLFRQGACITHQGMEQRAAHPSNSVTKTNVTIKVSLQPRDGGEVVNRRLQLPLDLDAQRIPMNGFDVVMGILSSAFKSELQPGVPNRLIYKDEEGDDIVVSSDHELGVALMQPPPLRLYLSQMPPF